MFELRPHGWLADALEGREPRPSVVIDLSAWWPYAAAIAVAVVMLVIIRIKTPDIALSTQIDVEPDESATF